MNHYGKNCSNCKGTMRAVWKRESGTTEVWWCPECGALYCRYDLNVSVPSRTEKLWKLMGEAIELFRE